MNFIVERCRSFSRFCMSTANEAYLRPVNPLFISHIHSPVNKNAWTNDCIKYLMMRVMYLWILPIHQPIRRSFRNVHKEKWKCNAPVNLRRFLSNLRKSLLLFKHLFLCMLFYVRLILFLTKKNNCWMSRNCFTLEDDSGLSNSRQTTSFSYGPPSRGRFTEWSCPFVPVSDQITQIVICPSVSPCLCHRLKPHSCIRSQPGLLRTKVYSAFHPSGVGKWVPAMAGKAKAGMAHSDCGWTCGCAGKTVKSLENTCHTSALLRWWFTTKRRYIKCMHLYLYTKLKQ